MKTPTIILAFYACYARTHTYVYVCVCVCVSVWVCVCVCVCVRERESVYVQYVLVISREWATRTSANCPALILIQSLAEARGRVKDCVFLSIITAFSDTCKWEGGCECVDVEGWWEREGERVCECVRVCRDEAKSGK